MEEIDFTLMSNIAEEVEREHEGLLPFTEMVNIMLSRYVAAQQSVQPTIATSALEDSPFETGMRRNAVVLSNRNSG